MIVIERRIGLVPYRRVYFARLGQNFHRTWLTSLRQYLGEPLPNWQSREFHTILIDLNHGEGELFRDIKKSTAYEIRRAEKDGIVFAEETNLETFRAFYNDFAPTKSLGLLGKANLSSMAKFLTITRADLAGANASDGMPLCMHAYLVDPEESRARLLYSATLVRDGAGVDRQILGRANRRLHWLDMLRFKAQGIRWYDLGGIAHMDEQEGKLAEAVTSDAAPATAGIDAFKTAFGGTAVREDHWDSPLLARAKGAVCFSRAILSSLKQAGRR
jgi:hypothetical protein